MNPVERNPEQDQAEQSPAAQPNDLAQAIISRTEGARAMLSPWVQRSLPPQTGPPEKPRLEAGARRRTALSELNTRTLVNRVQRKAEGSRVWRPDVGSLEPGLVDRFAGAIVRRFSTSETKYQVQPLDLAESERSSLTLPGERAELPSVPESTTSRPYPTMVDLERAIAAKTVWSRSQPKSAPTPGPVQRQPTEPSESGPRPAPVRVSSTPRAMAASERPTDAPT